MQDMLRFQWLFHKKDLRVLMGHCRGPIGTEEVLLELQMCYWHLDEPVEGNDVTDGVGEELAHGEVREDDPVGQPLKQERRRLGFESREL